MRYETHAANLAVASATVLLFVGGGSPSLGTEGVIDPRCLRPEVLRTRATEGSTSCTMVRVNCTTEVKANLTESLCKGECQGLTAAASFLM